VPLLWTSTAVASESNRPPPAAHVSCGDTIIVDTRLANDLSDCPGNGGNRARQSGDPAQCVGIRCR
jgi:hypothetical protein